MYLSARPSDHIHRILSNFLAEIIINYAVDNIHESAHQPPSFGTASVGYVQKKRRIYRQGKMNLLVALTKY